MYLKLLRKRNLHGRTWIKKGTKNIHQCVKKLRLKERYKQTMPIVGGDGQGEVKLDYAGEDVGSGLDTRWLCT